MQWCWVNYQCQGVLLICIRVGQGPTALAVGAGRDCLDIFSLICHFSFLSPYLWETARYRLKYCLKGSLSPKQPAYQPNLSFQFDCVLVTDLYQLVLPSANFSTRARMTMNDRKLFRGSSAVAWIAHTSLFG